MEGIEGNKWIDKIFEIEDKILEYSEYRWWNGYKLKKKYRQTYNRT